MHIISTLLLHFIQVSLVTFIVTLVITSSDTTGILKFLKATLLAFLVNLLGLTILGKAYRRRVTTHRTERSRKVSNKRYEIYKINRSFKWELIHDGQLLAEDLDRLFSNRSIIIDKASWSWSWHMENWDETNIPVPWWDHGSVARLISGCGWVCGYCE